jgi:hypothetical protein
MTTPPPPARLRPVNVLRALADLLRAAGITRLYGSACALYGVLSVAYGLTVWCDGQRLWWQANDDQATWPAADPEGAARILTTLARTPGTSPSSDGP